MEKQSLICTRKTSFYTDNINTHDSCIFDQLIANVCPVCTSDVLQTQTKNFEQPKNDSITSESQETLHVFRSMHLHYTAILVFFSAEFCTKSEEYFPRSFDIVVISDIPTRYLIFCTKWESSLFFINNIRNVTWPFPSAFIFLAAWRVFVRKHQKVCDVGTVVWCRTCTVRFFRSLLRLSSSFPPIWVCEMKVLWKVASSRAEDLKPIFYTWSSTAWRISLRQGNIL